MNKIDPCATMRNNLIAAALGLQQCTKTAANIVPLPGTERFIAIGTSAEIAQVLPKDDGSPAAPSAASIEGPTDQQILLAMRPDLDMGDGGFLGDTYPELVVAAGRALLATQSAKQGAQPSPRAPTDISARLREYASNPGYSHNDYADTMRIAADECERFYGGMLAWKQTAEKKDRDWAAERTARIDDRCIARAASQAAPEQAAQVQADARDAERYRYLRGHDASLETQQRDKGIINGPSCYHEVEGISELKWGVDLDSAIDAAMKSKRAASTDGDQKGGA